MEPSTRTWSPITGLFRRTFVEFLEPYLIFVKDFEGDVLELLLGFSTNVRKDFNKISLALCKDYEEGFFTKKNVGAFQKHSEV